MGSQRSEVQEIIWNIMKVVKEYLDKNDIPYFLLAGSLLGAVRHKGFIPWDDDIDIGIPRKQYELLLKNIENDLPEYLSLKTFYNDQNYYYCFARIVDNRHHTLRTGSEMERTEPIWVDIFPLDGLPDNPVVRIIHEIRLLYNRGMYHFANFDRLNLKRPGRPAYQKILIKFIQVTGFGRKGDAHNYLKKLDRLLIKYPYEKSKYVMDFMGQYMLKSAVSRKYYGKGRMFEFEDSELMGPIYPDRILTKLYGDYMEPPKNKNTHASEYIG